ncbi:MAG: four helix bundle protein [Opitutales bacterium]|nr:four helix bundle protein [Opitutales bacterium]
MEESAEPLLPPHGGYRKLKGFQVAQLAFDLTVRFCDRFVSKYSRTHDQMVQGARSGVQNIAEGSQASGTSKKTELKLTNVARSSLEELRLDYEDFLRQRKLPLWADDDPRRQALVDRRCRNVDEIARWAVELRNGHDGRDGQDRPSYEEIAANAAHVLIGVACSLLDRQIARLATDFEKEGGFTERLYRIRQQNRRRQGPSRQ